MMTTSLEELQRRLLEHANLGHKKRDDAFVRQVMTCCESPGGTGAGSASDLASVISAYRFADKASTALADLREVRSKVAWDSCKPGETILVINDVSELNYYNHGSKSDRRAIGDGQGKGYEYVCNLGVSLEREQCVGVLHDCVISESGPDDKDVIDYHKDEILKEISQKDPERLECNHKHILKCHAEHIAAGAPEGVRLTNVGDREFDDYFIFDGSLEDWNDFVIRAKADRNVQVSEDVKWLTDEMKAKKYAGLPMLPNHTCASMRRLVDGVPLTPFKTIPLDGKGRLCDEGSAKDHVEVSVGAFSVTLYRRIKRNQTYVTPKDYVNVNVVVLREIDPPDGRKAIEWVLYTSLPIDTIEKIAVVVRIYELRWIVECVFRYLKSGFKLEDLRYNNARKTAVHIVLITIATVYLMNLKVALGLPQASLLPRDDYDKVKRALKNPEDETIDKETRIFALISKLGGWKGRRGDPITPLTLLRGIAKLNDSIEVAQNALALLREMGAIGT